jgi:xanthine dehydrogenase YagS FAD-binding subunit
MKDVKYAAAKSFEEAAALLADGKSALLAGGTDLVYGLKGMHTPNLPDTVIDIKRIPNAAYIKEEGGFLKIGALTKLTDIAESDVVKKNYAALAEAAKLVASPELRNMGTIGGNICQKPRCIYYRNEFNHFPCARKVKGGTCYAISGVCRYHSIFGGVGGCMAVCPSDTAPALVALGAKIVTTKKTWEAADFFKVQNKEFGTARGEQINALDLDEVVKEIQVPTPAAGTKSTYKKWAFRKAIDFPQVSAAVVVAGGKAQIALGGVYNEPKFFADVDASDAAKAADTVLAKANPLTSPQKRNNTNKYKVQIAKTMVKRAIEGLK